MNLITKLIDYYKENIKRITLYQIKHVKLHDKLWLRLSLVDGSFF